MCLPAPARALGIADIDPLYFGGPSGFGFDDADLLALGISPRFAATVGDDWIDAGNAALGLPIQVEQSLGPVHSNPQAAGRTPSFLDPFIADSTWTVHNRTGRRLLQPLLLFTVVDPSAVYPNVPTALDAALVDIVEYSSGGVDYRFGSVALPDLGDGESFEIDVRYVVAGALVQRGATLVMPPLGLMALGTYTSLPEPTPGVLVALALVAGAVARRGSSA